MSGNPLSPSPVEMAGRGRPRRLPRLLGGLSLILGAAGLVAYLVTPWPSVWVIRAIFDKGAAEASAKLEKFLPDNVTARREIRYDPDDPDSLLDVYAPADLDPSAPTIVWVHGGGFVSGRREDIANYLQVLAGHGFAVVNVDYTIAPGATYPTPVRQVSRALVFLDRKAEELGVNRKAIVMAGDSAGAQIAAQVSNIITAPRYAEAVGISPPIRAEQLKGALLYCGFYDVGGLGARNGEMSWFMRTVTWAYSGKRDWRSSEEFERVSVARYVTPAFPPVFISAGNDDPLGPQSHLMDAALRKAGVPVHALFYPANHPAKLGHEYQFALDTPDGQTALRESVAWLAGLGSGGIGQPD